jgi:hypothetical protein
MNPEGSSDGRDAATTITATESPLQQSQTEPPELTMKVKIDDRLAADMRPEDRLLDGEGDLCGYHFQ